MNPMAAMIAALWEKNLPLVRERVGLLERAAEACVADTLGTEQRRQAEEAAHKLAGSLGMYGRVEAGGTASSLEQLLEGDSAVDAGELSRLVRDLRRNLFG